MNGASLLIVLTLFLCLDQTLNSGDFQDVKIAWKKNLLVIPSNSTKYQLFEQYPIKSGTARADIKKCDKVKRMMRFAWFNYKAFTWGDYALSPFWKCRAVSLDFGDKNLSTTIIDSLDTLYLMGLHKEFEEGRKWIAENFSFKCKYGFSTLQANHIYVGGFLSLYALTGDPLYLKHAESIANHILMAFQTPTGIPMAEIVMDTGEIRNVRWKGNFSSVLGEIGGFHLEFTYLSDLTGNSVYKETVQKVRQVLRGLEKPEGLYYSFINPYTGQWDASEEIVTMGTDSGTFFEYLLKSWLQSGKTDTEAKEMFEEATPPIIEHLLQTSVKGLMYLAEIKNNDILDKMSHAACFAGGMFGMASRFLKTNSKLSHRYMEIAENLTNTCHESYIRSELKLGPSVMNFNSSVIGMEAAGKEYYEHFYDLTADTFESYFILWRLTHKQKYRDWAWEGVQAIEKHCRSRYGYHGIYNVYWVLDSHKTYYQTQQPYFMAKTLKYLYLIFSDDSLVSLDEWVFNKEGHLLPIKGMNRFYKRTSSKRTNIVGKDKKKL